MNEHKRRGRPPNHLRQQQSAPMADAAPQIVSEPEDEITFPDPNAVPMHETPEFKRAVHEAATAAVRDALAGEAATALRSAVPAPSGDPNDVIKSLAEQFAIAISTMTNQGTNARAPLAPAEVNRRAQAAGLMHSLIRKAREMTAMGDRDAAPLYELRNKVFIGDFVTDPIWTDASKKLLNTEIRWPHVPNEVMIPKNETAKLIHAAFLDSIGGTAAKLTPDRDVHMGSHGFVVNGQAPQGRAAGLVPSASASGMEIVRDESRVPGENRRVNILGTIQAPAVQPV